MSIYNVGAGIADITDPAVGLVMQGMADPSQITTGVESRLYARTFIIEDPQSTVRVVLVTADIWSGTEAIKTEVTNRLQSQFNDTYTEANLLISGTHTHSAPGGFSNHQLYESTGGGFDPHTFECIVSGIVRSIQNAHENLSPGKIYLSKGEVQNCGGQRSSAAYRNNPAAERARYQNETDKEMTLLKFVTLDGNKDIPLGILSWYPIHPTDRGQTNTLVNGDNKGFAAALFEQEMGTDYAARETFVAAFANANAGDVSGNVDFGAIPDGIHDKSHMEEHGRKQFEAAGILFNLAGEELEGSLDHRHTRVDMAQVQLTDGSGSRTFPAGLGLSFAAGSTEDSIPRIKVGRSTRNSFKLKEGIRDDNMSPSERTDQAAIISGLAATFGITQNSADFVSGHLPKPLILAPDLLNPPITPNVLPLQLIKVGNLLITAVPGEITTMAGRRLRETLLLEFQSAGIEHLALAAYANAYSQYITTKEEYDAQHYEGASTLFGPHTLAAYQQEFLKLAQSLQSNIQSAPGPNPSPPSAKTIRRVTFRNLSNKTIKLEIYDQIIFQFAMDLAISKLSELDLAPGTDLACIVPGHISEIKARIDGGDVVENIQTHQLVTIPQNGSAIATTYVPPDLPLKNKSTLGRNAPSKVLHPVLNIMMN